MKLSQIKKNTSRANGFQQSTTSYVAEEAHATA
jgi:hypothetical protein